MNQDNEKNNDDDDDNVDDYDNIKEHWPSFYYVTSFIHWILKVCKTVPLLYFINGQKIIIIINK